MQVGEVEPLLTGRGAVVSSGGGGGGSGGSTIGTGGGGKRKEVVQMRKEKVKAALEENKMPSAELLRRQAREMSRNPAIVRKANPEMRHLTDAQV